MTDLCSSDLTSIVTEVLRNAPAWVRSDLAARDRAVRTRAEETLAAMITAALAQSRSVPEEMTPPVAAAAT